LSLNFDAFIAIDWSGAVRNYDGIAVAVCRRGESPPRLVKPRLTPGQARWTRRAIAGWLEEQIDRDERLLIGFDFAFGFPYEQDDGYLGGRASGVDDIFALWSLIESKSCADPDFGCAGFLKHTDYVVVLDGGTTAPAMDRA
jgi:hypothetical protein